MHTAVLEAPKLGRKSPRQVERKGLVERRRSRPAAGSDRHGTNIAACYASSGMAYIPTVIENEGGNRERAFDIYSRLLRDRVIILGRPIDDTMANLIVAQLIFLSADDPEKEIQIYINSPGGSVSAGFAIYDTMQYVPAPIMTVAMGMAASFATVILMSGAKGKRFALSNARIHLHQPLIGGRGLSGQASDLEIHANEIIRVKKELNQLIAQHSGQPLEKIERDTDRDFYLSPEEAIDYGLIDGVITAPPVPVDAKAGKAS
jgi:ATP-dependent Clp protease, protease subunit